MKKIGCLIVFAGIILAINSCNESVIEQDGLLKSSSIYNEVIERAKIWFNDAPEENDFPVFAFTDEIKWNQAIVHDVDTAFMIEIPIKLKANNELGVEGDKSLNIEQRLLIQKQEETFTSYIEFLISSNTKEELSNIKKVNIQYCKDNEADVTILCIDKKGKPAIRKQFKTTNTETSVELNLKSATYMCIGWFILWSDGSKDLIDILYCYETGGNNYNSSGPSGSGAGSTPPVNTDNCHCNICQVCGGCTDLDQDLLKSFTDPGEYGEETINCPVCPNPELHAAFDDHPCLETILNTLMNGTEVDLTNLIINPTLTADILNLFDMSNTVDLTIEVADLENNDVNGRTSRIDGTDDYKIVLNDSYVNSATDLSIARTMIHEIIHANLLYQIDQRSGDDFDQLYSIWNIMNGDPNQSKEYQHEFMVGIADVIAENLFEWCRQSGTFVDFNYLEKLAWGGLENTETYKNFSYSERTQIHSYLLNEKLGNYDAKGRICN